MKERNSWSSMKSCFAVSFLMKSPAVAFLFAVLFGQTLCAEAQQEFIDRLRAEESIAIWTDDLGGNVQKLLDAGLIEFPNATNLNIGDESRRGSEEQEQTIRRVTARLDRLRESLLDDQIFDGPALAVVRVDDNQQIHWAVVLESLATEDEVSALMSEVDSLTRFLRQSDTPNLVDDDEPSSAQPTGFAQLEALPICWAMSGDLLCVANDAALGKEILSQSSGQIPTRNRLVDNRVFKRVLSNGEGPASDERLFSFYVSANAIAEQSDFLLPDRAIGANLPNWSRAWRAIHLDNLLGFGGTAFLVNDDKRESEALVVNMSVPTAVPRRGPLAAIDPDNAWQTDLSFPAVPGAVSALSYFDLDGKQLTQKIERTIDRYVAMGLDEDRKKRIVQTDDGGSYGPAPPDHVFRSYKEILNRTVGVSVVESRQMPSTRLTGATKVRMLRLAESDSLDKVITDFSKRIGPTGFYLELLDRHRVDRDGISVWELSDEASAEQAEARERLLRQMDEQEEKYRKESKEQGVDQAEVEKVIRDFRERLQGQLQRRDRDLKSVIVKQKDWLNLDVVSLSELDRMIARPNENACELLMDEAHDLFDTHRKVLPGKGNRFGMMIFRHSPFVPLPRIETVNEEAGARSEDEQIEGEDALRAKNVTCIEFRDEGEAFEINLISTRISNDQ